MEHPSSIPSPHHLSHLLFGLDLISLWQQEQFLQERIKVNGKTKNLSTNIVIERKKSKVAVTSEIAFSKRWVFGLLYFHQRARYKQR